MARQPKRMTFQVTFAVSAGIAPEPGTISFDAYKRVMAECERTGMAIDEVLDIMILRALPDPRAGEDEDSGGD